MAKGALPMPSLARPDSGREVGWLPGPAGGTRQQDRKLLGGLVLAIGSVWIAVPLLALVAGAAPPLPDLGTAGSCSLVAVGAAHALWALHLLLHRQTLTVDQSTVEVAVRSLRGVRRWREPLASYRGLRHRRERVYHRYGWRVLHVIELAHHDPTRVIGLLRTRDEALAEACGRSWAKSLDLPLLAAELAPHPRTTLDRAPSATAPEALAPR